MQSRERIAARGRRKANTLISIKRFIAQVMLMLFDLSLGSREALKEGQATGRGPAINVGSLQGIEARFVHAIAQERPAGPLTKKGQSIGDAP
jgi:hypothetical protein